MKITKHKKKDGSTVYRSSVYLGIDAMTGEKVKTTVTGRTQREVKQKALQAKRDFIDNGETRQQPHKLKTYADLAALWWESYQHTVKPATVIAIRGRLRNHLLPLFGAYKLDKLTTPIIQHAVNQLAEKANKGEPGAFLDFGELHSLNKRILQYGVVMQAIPYNPAREVILPRNTAKQNRQKLKHWEREEVGRFLAYLDSLDPANFRNLYDVTLYRLLLATGCRIGEVMALEWSDIDLDTQTVSITKTLNALHEINSPKSKTSIRLIDIDGETVQRLKRYRLAQKKEGLKLGRRETVVFSDFVHPYPRRQVIVYRLEKIHTVKADVPYIGFHGFRHTHASLLLNAGIPYKELQHRLGHSTLSMTMDVYSHLSKEKAKNAVSLFEKAVGDL